jgi:NAD(P)-dependent dehydrogenase (short-subunit alcohol dehydrogenase family)
MDIYANKTAIVTGGASGIGRAVSEQLASRGANVILADINAELLEETAKAINNTGGKAKALPLDVRDSEAVKKVVDDTVAEFGRLDYIFNNAGIAIASEAHEHIYESWRKVIDTNLYGVINGAVAAYPVMVEQGSGHIVNTASMAGLVPVFGEVSYVTSKHGVVGLSLALRIEGALHGVKVSVVCPGFIRTPIYDNIELIKLDREALMKMAPKGASAQKAAQVILEDVERNRAVIVPPRQARVLWWLNRAFPILTIKFLQRLAATMFKKSRVEG